MAIDIATEFVLLAMICSVIGLVFVGSWITSGGTRLYLKAAVAALFLATGMILVLFRGVVPDRMSIDAANLLMVLGFGIAWSAVRTFEGRPASLILICAGAAIWLVACLFPHFHDGIGNRIALQSLTSAAYSVAAGSEFWRGRYERLQTRVPVALLLFIHAGFAVARGVYSYLNPPIALFVGTTTESLLTAEPVLMVVALSLLCIGLVRERTENTLRRHADTDELTGVLSRRAMFAGAEALLANARRDQKSVAVLLFDLDRFKDVNDRFGHQIGDQTLQGFTRLASRAIRADDLFGRLGGEEFAAVLLGVDARTAHVIAERIRLDFANSGVEHDGQKVSTTVSVGIAASPAAMANLTELLALADQALYEAKREGRDRVRSALALAG